MTIGQKRCYILKFVSMNREKLIQYGLASLFATLVLSTILLLMLASNVATQGPLEAAMAAYNNKDYQTAIGFFQQALARNSGADIYFYLGNCYYNLGRYEEARKAYQDCLIRKKGYRDALFQLGQTYLALNKLPEALDTFKKGIKDLKDAARFQNGLGLVNLALNRYNDADLAFRTAISLDAKNPEYHKNLGDVNFKTEVYTIAIDEYRTALALDSNLNAIRFPLAKALLALRDFNGAVAELKNVIRIEPGNTEAYLQLGRLYFLTQPPKYREAIWCYTEFTKQDTLNPQAYLNLARAYYALHLVDSTVVSAERALNLDSKLVEAYYLLALAQQDQKNYAGAVEAYNAYEKALQAIRGDTVWATGDAEFFQKRGEAYLALNDSTKLPLAIQNLQKALTLDTARNGIYGSLGLAYYLIGQFENAIPWFQKRLERDSTSYATWMNLALALRQLQRFDEEIDALQRAITLKPDNLSPRQHLGQAYVFKQDYTGARIAYLEVLKLDTANFDAAKWVGFSYLVDNKGLEALPYLDRAYRLLLVKGNKPCTDKDLPLWIAQSNALAKRYQEAKRWYQKALDCDPNNAAAKDGLRRIELQE